MYIPVYPWYIPRLPGQRDSRSDSEMLGREAGRDVLGHKNPTKTDEQRIKTNGNGRNSSNLGRPTATDEGITYDRSAP